MTAESAAGLFIWALGLCVGSFLNVVIYRLPAGLSIASPTWSFCPRCSATLSARDNVPLLSWLLLRGRCRHCTAPISPQYPLVESATGLAFALVYYLLFIADHADGRHVTLPTDAALLAAWLILAAVMIVCSAMDVLTFSIFPGVTNVGCALAIAAYAFWPRAEVLTPLAASPIAPACIAALLAALVMMRRSAAAESNDDGESESTDPDKPSTDVARAAQSPKGACVAAMILLAAVALWMLLAPPAASPLDWPVGVSLAALLALLVLAGGEPRGVDDDIHEAIEQEAPQSRGMALREIAWLAPSILAGAAAWLLVAHVPVIGEAWRAIVQWSPGGGFIPAAGIAHSVVGLVVGAAIGWIVRIVFTLALGREALGSGDIFILACAGAAAGWEIALIGFVLSIGFALAGWIIGLVLKRSAMIPFGPPLALGFVAALWLRDLARDVAWVYGVQISEAWAASPRLVLMMAATVIVAAAVAVALLRLIRARTAER